MKIAILDDYQDAVKSLQCFQLLHQHDVVVLNQSYEDPIELASHLIDVEALVLIRERTKISADLLRNLPSLRLISQTGKVSHHIDPDLCQQFGVRVVEGIGSPVAPAELTWTLIMAASRNLTSYCNSMQAGNWQQSDGLGLGRSLEGLTLGIWGYGKIGQRISGYATAFGMNLLIWGSDQSRDLARQQGHQAADTKEQLFEQSDVVSIHLRLSETTRQCIKETDLALMKSDSLFVNTSRAELVEPNALFRQLYKNPTKRAAIDVYEIEPVIPDKNPILALPNVLCAPHLGYVERGSYELYFSVAFENLLNSAAELQLL